jgi:hypothetical protein
MLKINGRIPQLQKKIIETSSNMMAWTKAGHELSLVYAVATVVD